MASLGGAVLAILVTSTLVALGAGRCTDVSLDIGATLLYGLSLVIAPVVFVAVGAVASQLGGTRRVANSISAWCSPRRS